MKHKILAAISILSFVTLIAVLVLNGFTNELFSKISGEENIGASKPPIFVNDNIRALNQHFVALSDALIPTVVSISVVTESTSETRDDLREFFKFFGQPYNEDNTPRRSEASGSGVIITPDGYIVTNNHVVEKATEIKVTTNDRKEHIAKLIGTDPLTDLAVIKIDAENLKVAHFANMDNVKVGEWVVAIGNPLGLNSTITSGIISAIGRGELSLSNRRDGYAVEHFIQTDAAINPGNSGGGLFNLEGSLVGINTAIATQTGTYIGYGFAIPVDLTKAVVLDLIENGKIDRGYIGVQIRTVDEIMARSVGLDKVQGAVVHDVVKDSPAEKAGIESGDIILEVDGKPINSSHELQSVIVKKKAGDNVTLTLWRDQKKVTKQVKLKAKDESSDYATDDAITGETPPDKIEAKSFNFDNLGFSVEQLNSKIKEDYSVENGVLVSKVNNYSIASQRGLYPNGVIIKADRQNIKNISDLKKIIESKSPGDAILLQVKYKDANRMIALDIPKK